MSPDFGVGGTYRPKVTPFTLAVRAGKVFVFGSGPQKPISIEVVPLERIQPEELPEPVDPASLAYRPDDCELTTGGILYLLSKAHRLLLRWDVSRRRYLSSVRLRYDPKAIAYSHELNGLYVSHESGAVTSIDLDDLSEKFFLNVPTRAVAIAAAGRYLFVCDASGPWASHITYDPLGRLVSWEKRRLSADEFVWSASAGKMFFVKTGGSPRALVWEKIENGVIREQREASIHEDAAARYPVRVAPDGSQVLLGSGRIYDSETLKQIGKLGHEILDAAWTPQGLFSIRYAHTGTQIIKWSDSFDAIVRRTIQGQPLRIFDGSTDGTAGFLVVVTLRSSTPAFTYVSKEDVGNVPVIEKPFIRGDCDCDARLSISDAILLLRVVFLGLPAQCLDACDAGESGTLELSDPLALWHCLFAAGPTPKPPYPDCGPDPTPDNLSCESLNLCP